MPEKQTLEPARKDAREGKSPSIQAGEFVREEIRHAREGKHGAASPKQTFAIGLSNGRRAAVKLPSLGGRNVSSKRRKKQSVILAMGGPTLTTRRLPSDQERPVKP